jgi:microcystin-dependent protein
MATTKPADDMIRFTEYIPVGCAMMWPFTTLPSTNVCEYAIPAGQTLSRTTYATLWALANGVNGFGVGDGSTTFTLPDWRGRFPLGVSGSYALGSTGGAATHVLTSNEMPPHVHDMDSRNRGDFAFDTQSMAAPDGGGTGNIVTGSTGGGAAHNNMPPYFAVNFIMRIK